MKLTRRASRTLSLLLLLATLLSVAAPAAAQRTHGWSLAWGSNGRGQLGTTGGASASPVDVGLPAGLPAARGLSAGEGHSLAVTTAGDVYAWGANTFGQLGRDTFGLGTDSPVPVKVAIPEPVSTVAAGAQHSLAVTVSGQVYAWGNNIDAQLGLDPNAVGFSARPIRVDGLPAGDPVVEIVAGRSHSVARLASGVLYAWGSNLLGQLGTGPLLVLVPKPTLVPSLANVRAVGAGANHTLAVVGPEGAVYAWGDNGRGQLADLDSDGRFNPVPTATPVSGASAVDGGAAHSAALLENGKVWTWGDNARDQLGHPGSAPAAVGDLSGALEISAGGNHTLAIVTSGDRQHVRAWGDDASGQLGDGSAGGTSATPVRAGSIATAVAVAAGTSHSLGAAAPRASLSPTSIEFPGVIEVGRTTPSQTITLKNHGPGPLVVSEVVLPGAAEGQADFTLVDGCGGKTLAKDGTCAVEVAFSPKAAGMRTATVTFQQDGFDGPLYVSLSGLASVVAGAISISTDPVNLIDGVPASPSRVPIDAIPIQPGSPAAADLNKIGDLPTFDPTKLGDLPTFDPTKIGDLPTFDVTKLGDLPTFDPTKIGDLPTFDVTKLGPAGEEILRTVPLSSLPLVAPYSWNGSGDPTPILSGSPLADLPLQHVSVLDVIRDPIAAPRLEALKLVEVDWSSSKLGGLGIIAMMLGSTRLADITIAPAASPEETWCAGLDAALGTSDCARAYGRDPSTDANGLTASALEMQLVGVPYSALPIAAARLGEIDPVADAPYLKVPLTAVDLYRSELGGVAVSSITPDPGAVVDCTKTSCSTATLYEAAGDGALRAGATVADLGEAVSELTLGGLALGLLSYDQDLFGTVPLDRMGILPYAGAGTSAVTYQVSFTNDPTNPLPDGSSIEVTLPTRQFSYVLDSTVMTVDGQAAEATGPVFDDGVLRWGIASSVPAGGKLLLTFDLRPGFTLGTFTVPSVSIGTEANRVTADGPSAPIRVVESLEGRGIPANDEPSHATTIRPSRPDAPGELVVSHVSGADDRDLYTFTADPQVVPPGSTITVHLNHLAADADLAFFYPAGTQPEAPLRAPRAGASLMPLPDELPRLDATSTSLQGNAQSDIDLVPGLPLAGLSQNRTVNSEFVRAVAVPASAGDVYTIEVVGYNGAFSDAPYSLRVMIEPPATLPPCEPRAFAHPLDPAVLGTVPSASSLDGAENVFLVANGRLQRMYGADGQQTVDAALDRLVADTALRDVIGRSVVLPVDANDGSGNPTAVQRAYEAWDANPCDPQLGNDVVRSITGLMDRVLPSGVRNVIVVGVDDAVPFGRVPDRTIRVNEDDFASIAASATSANNALVGALARGRFITDDAYGLPDVVARPGGYAYVPRVGLGRLVEQPAHIAAAIDDFRLALAAADPATALTTSAEEFLSDAAIEMHEALSETLGSTQQTLIDGDWTRDDLRSAFTAASDPPDVVALNGHADPWNTMPKVGSTYADLFGTGEIATANDIENLILFSVGCHTGTSIANTIARADGPGADWAEALAARRVAAFVGQGGYGVGSRSTIALTEQLMLDFARGIGRTTLGMALTEAKRSYFANTASFDVFDEKAMMEAIYYGIPAMRIAGVTPPSYSPPTLATGTDETTGLPTASIAVQATDPTGAGYFSLQKHDTEEGSYWSANGGITSDEGRPVQPSLSLDVTRSGLRAHGALITGLVSVDEVNVDPVIAHPVPTDATLRDPEPQVGDLVFPTAVQAIRSTSGPGARDRLTLVPGSFSSSGRSPAGATVGRQRLFRSVNAQVLYADRDVEDFLAPIITSVDAVIVGGVATFAVRAHDPTPDDSVTKVVVLYHEAGNATWKPLSLLRSPSDPLRWSGGIGVTGTKVEFLVQAVDEHGNVATTANKGRYFEALPPPENTGDVQVTITGTRSASGWYSDATVSLVASDPGTTIEVRVDDGRSSLYTQPIVFVGDGTQNPPPGAHVGDGYRLLRYKTSTGDEGLVAIPMDNAPPVVTVRTPAPDGSSAYVVGEEVHADFSCADSASGLVADGCVATVDGAPITDGGALPTTGGTHVLTVTATDVAGHVTVTSVPYVVRFEFEGFLSPVKNRPEKNHYNAGQTIALKWRLRDAEGNLISDLGTVRSTGSFQINCDAPPPLSSEAGDPTSSKSGLTWDGDHFQYNWETKKGLPPVGWQGTCRRFVLILSDDSVHSADFVFS